MAVKTVYCVQAFRGSQKRLVAMSLRQFGYREAALQGAEEIKETVAGCVVFRVRGDPAIDSWDEPEVLATFGLVPEPSG